MSIISGFGGVIRSFAVFILIELFLITGAIFIMGTFTDPLPIMVALAEQMTTDTTTITVVELGVGFFACSSFFNFILMFWNIVRE